MYTCKCIPTSKYLYDVSEIFSKTDPCLCFLHFSINIDALAKTCFTVSHVVTYTLKSAQLHMRLYFLGRTSRSIPQLPNTRKCTKDMSPANRDRRQGNRKWGGQSGICMYDTNNARNLTKPGYLR